MLVHVGLRLDNRKDFQQLTPGSREFGTYWLVMILSQIDCLVLSVVTREGKNF